MKTKLLIVIGLTILITSMTSYANCRCEGGCTCVDPACRRYVGNECMSRERCCEAFGNIAGTDFSSAEETGDFNTENTLFFQNFSYAPPKVYHRHRSYKGE